MQTFMKFFWLLTIVGLAVIGAFMAHKLLFERTAHAQQSPREAPARMHPPVDDAVPEAPADAVKDVALPTEVIERLIEKRAKPVQHSDIELYLSFAVLAFGFLLMLGQFVIMLRERRYFDNMSLKMLTITMAITSALFLITAGFSSDQIQPAIGLISGTLGFAFGLRGDTPQPDPPPPPVPVPSVKP